MKKSVNPDPALGELLQAIKSPWLIARQIPLPSAPTDFLPPEVKGSGSKSSKRRLSAHRKQIRALQRPLYAGRQYSILLIFQALDAAGKDGAIREVLKGLDVSGINVAAFKRPTPSELAHDFLWRTSKELPQRGFISAFNRSYYEEVLAVRVHPEFLDAQYNGANFDAETLWIERFRAIREHERHLACANTVILKFWLNVSPGQQAKRFSERLENPRKHWKFSMRDVYESDLRQQYDEALVDMLNQTSRPWAPWFCIPADDRWYLREQIADILQQTLSFLPLQYPSADIPEGKERDDLSRRFKKRIKASPT